MKRWFCTDESKMREYGVCDGFYDETAWLMECDVDMKIRQSATVEDMDAALMVAHETITQKDREIAELLGAHAVELRRVENENYTEGFKDAVEARE